MFAMKKLILAVFAITAVVATSANADAAFAIRVTQGANVVSVHNGTSFAPVPPTTAGFTDLDFSPSGIVAFSFAEGASFTVGTFKISGFTGSIGTSGPTASVASLGVNVSSSAAGTITFEFSRTGYSFPAVGNIIVANSFSTTGPGLSNTLASVNYQSWINSDNTLFSQAGVSGPQIGVNQIAPGSQGSGISLSTLALSAIPFSITTRTTFTFTAPAGDVGYNSRTDVTPPANIVPAPAGLLLSLLGLPALAIARRFRRAVPVQA